MALRGIITKNQFCSTFTQCSVKVLYSTWQVSVKALNYTGDTTQWKSSDFSEITGLNVRLRRAYVMYMYFEAEDWCSCCGFKDSGDPNSCEI